MGAVLEGEIMICFYVQKERWAGGMSAKVYIQIEGVEV